MTIKGDTGGKGTRAIATRYPIEDGIIGGTTKQTGHIMNLVAEKGSVLPKRFDKGL